jgi:hypothetical protein
MECYQGTFRNTGEIALGCDRATIEGGVFLNNGFTAEGEVLFLNATIKKDLICTEAQFLGAGVTGLNASQATITGALVWQNITLSSHTQLVLTYAQVGLLDDSQGSWPARGSLQIDGFTYASIAGPPSDTRRRRAWLTARLDWLQRQADQTFSLQPYVQLASVLRRSGHEAEAKRVLYAQQETLRQRGHLGIGVVRNWLLRIGIGHGYYPSWALGWAIGIALLGALIFHYGYQYGLLVAAKDPPPTTFHPLMYSVDTLLPIIDFHQEAGWLPQGNTWINWYFWLHIALGWVLVTLGVIGFTGLVRRE